MNIQARTYSWTDPSITAAQLGRLSGLDMLTTIGTGELPRPPIFETLGIDGFEASGGKIMLTMTPQPFHYNPLGTVHGGVLATLLDTAAGCAVHSTLPVGFGYTTLDLTAKFLRPVTVDSGELRGEGSVLNRGRTIALGEAKLYDATGRLVAYASSSCLIFDVPPA